MATGGLQPPDPSAACLCWPANGDLQSFADDVAGLALPVRLRCELVHYRLKAFPSQRSVGTVGA